MLFGGGASLELNAEHYITKRVLPPLDRVFKLVGVDVFKWFKQEQRKSRRPPLDRQPLALGAGVGTIRQWAQSAHCVLCDALCTEQQTICSSCAATPAVAACVLQLRLSTAERQLDAIERHCMRCAGVHERQGAAKCRSLDCPHLYTRLKLSRQLSAATGHAAKATATLSIDF